MTAAIGLRERVAALLARSRVLEAALQIRRLAPISTVSIITYHRIADVTEHDPYDPDVVDATPAQFRRQVEAIARIGRPIGMDDLIAALDGARLPANPIMVTFDDGYRSCRDVALPILRALGVPATFFIATAFVSEPRLYWWEQIAVVLHRARGRVATLSYPRPMTIDASDPRARRRLDDTIKNTYGLDVDRFLRELRIALDVPWSPDIEAQLAARLCMTWDDVRALADAGMDIGSHTRTHRVLETLDEPDLRGELVGSRRELELQLRRPVRALAYPVGRLPPSWLRRVVAQSGYRIGLTNAGGVNRIWPTAMLATRSLDRFGIRRLRTERSLSDAMFLTQIAIPGLAAMRSPLHRLPPGRPLRHELQPAAPAPRGPAVCADGSTVSAEVTSPPVRDVKESNA